MTSYEQRCLDALRKAYNEACDELVRLRAEKGTPWSAVMQKLLEVRGLVAAAGRAETRRDVATGWLIEWVGTDGHRPSGPTYWTAGACYTASAGLAVRFARQVDANEVIKVLPAFERGRVRAIEHAWIPAAT